MRNISKTGVNLAISGLLIAIGIVIPMFSPVKIPLGPFGSFTLASHVAIFIAMFISPYMALAVAVGTTAGFFLGGFPPVIVWRAASHVIFAMAGAFYLRRFAKQDLSGFKLRVFSFVVALIHAASEVVVVSIFYFVVGGIADNGGFFMTVIVMVGFVTVVHSMVDLEIANLVMMPLRKSKILR